MNQITQKARKIANEAINAYEVGDFSSGDKLRKELNRILEDKKGIKEEIDNEKFGINKNFGIIHHIMESNSLDLFKTKEGKVLLSKYIKMIKENKTLQKEFNVYNAVCEKKNIDDIDQYVENLSTEIQYIPKSTIIEENSKLISFIRKNNINENVEVDENLRNVFNSIEYIMTHKKSVGNINEMMKSKSNIAKFISENGRNDDEKKNIDEEYVKFIQDLDYKYYGMNLDENDEKFIKMFVDAKYKNNLSEQKNIADEYSKYLVEKIDKIIDEQKDDSIKERFVSIKNKIENYNDENILNKFSKLVEINETISEK